MKRLLFFLCALVVSIGTAWAQFAAPTTNPTEPTDKAARVIAVYSDHYNKGLTEGQYNSDWGGGPTANKWSSLTEQEIVDGHKVVHVVGYGFHNRTANSTALTSDYSIAHVAIYPKTATKFKIYADGGYSWANVVSDDAHPLTPGQWNYIEVSGVSLSTNFISIALWDSENNLETEFYLDHFYFAKPPIDDSVAPVLNTCSVTSTNCVSATLTLKATDETSETVSYKITDTNSSTVYNTSGASGSEISYVIGGLLASTDYTFSVVAVDENDNESAATVVNATTSAYPAIPVSDKLEANVKTVYGQFGNATGLSKTSGTDYDGMSRTVVKFKNNNAQFSLPADPEFDASDMDYIHYDVLSDVDTPVALFVENRTENWKGKDVEGGLTAGVWTSFDIPVSFFINDCAQTMTKVINMALIKAVANKTGHDGFDDFSSPFPTLYIANVYFWKDVPAEKTVTFVNDQNWENVRVWAWNDTENFTGGTWPGVALTDNGDGTFTWSTTGDPSSIKFSNNGANETATFAFVDGAVYNSQGMKYTVSFKNSIGWETVKAYTENAKALGDWPGTTMTKEGDVYTISFYAATTPTKLIFNNGGTGNLNQTADLTVIDGKTYDMGFFIAGDMNSWTVDPDYAMTLNTGAATTEYQFGPTALTKDAELKAVLSRDGETIAAYYPAGTDNSYTITADGDYNIYLRPNADGGDDWYNHVIYVARQITSLTLSPSGTVEMEVGDNGDLEVTDQSGNAVAASLLNFASADPTIVTIDANGHAVAVAEGGPVVITVSLNADPSVTATLNVTVTGATPNELIDTPDSGTGIHVLTGTWDGGEFATLDATAQATAYDVRGLSTTFDGNAINTVKKNALFIARADQNIPRNKVVDNGDNTYTGYNIEILDYSEYNGLNTEMNTSISPITGTVNYHRVLPRAGIYLTMVVPFGATVPSDCNAYEATTSTNNAGDVTITFTEVDNLEAGVPYLIHATNGGVHLGSTGLNFSQSGDKALTDGAFKGTYVPINPVPDHVYVMPKGDPAVNAEFRLASTGSYIPAFRAYIQLNNTAAKIQVLISDATGIHAATAEQIEGIFNIYSIDGKLVRQNSDSKVGLQKGIYIINGKKVIVK